MLPNDLVNLSDPLPFGAISYYTHILIGLLGLIAALVALSVTKGSDIHKLAGKTFLVCLSVVLISSIVMLYVRFTAPLFVATATALYAATTGVLALQPANAKVMWSERILFGLEILTVLVFLYIAIPNVISNNIPPIGPIVIIIIPVILLIGDVYFFSKAKQRGQLRIFRHLSRMIWVFVITVRAPLVEINGHLNIPLPIILFVPIVLAPLMIIYFKRRVK